MIRTNKSGKQGGMDGLTTLTRKLEQVKAQAFESVNGWKHITLGDIASEPNCLIQTGPFGSQLHKHEYRDHGVGVVNPTHLSDNRIAHEDVPHVSNGTASRLERHRLAPGDILFARRGEIGRHGLVSESENGWLCGTGCFLVRIRREDVNNHFLSFFLTTRETVDWLNRHAAGVVMPNLSNSVLHRVPIALPGIAEQRKIAGVLGLAQRALKQQERLIALTTELKKALLHQLFTQGLRGELQKQTEIGPVPESWEVVKLEHVAQIERGKFTHRPRNDPRFYGGKTPFVQTGDVSSCDGRIRGFSQTLNEEGLLISKVFPAGTILITIAANIGFSGILEFDSACPDSLIGLTPNERIDIEFLQHYLTTQQPVMDRLAPRGTQKNINIQFLKPWPVVLPPKDEQSEIREALNAIDSKTRVARRKHTALAALFRTLLHQLMTAQIRIDKLDIEEFIMGIS